jgi:hypothetical protein
VFVLCGDILVAKEWLISVADAAETPAISNPAANVIEICFFMTITSTIRQYVGENAQALTPVRHNAAVKMPRGLLPRR